MELILNIILLRNYSYKYRTFFSYTHTVHHFDSLHYVGKSKYSIRDFNGQWKYFIAIDSKVTEVKKYPNAIYCSKNIVVHLSSHSVPSSRKEVISVTSTKWAFNVYTRLLNYCAWSRNRLVCEDEDYVLGRRFVLLSVP